MNEAALTQLHEFLKQAEQTFTYEMIFDLSGVSDILGELYLTPKELRKEYVDLLYKGVKQFLAEPLFKDLKINDRNDLEFLSKSDEFKEKIRAVISQIKKKLSPRSLKLFEYFKKFEKKSKLSTEKIMSNLKMDKASLLFMLDDLKETHKIYDYNGREVTLR